MSFLEIANRRQSCRNYNSEKEVETEKLEAVLEAGRIAHICHFTNQICNIISSACGRSKPLPYRTLVVSCIRFSTQPVGNGLDRSVQIIKFKTTNRSFISSFLSRSRRGSFRTVQLRRAQAP